MGCGVNRLLKGWDGCVVGCDRNGLGGMLGTGLHPGRVKTGEKEGEATVLALIQ